MFCDATFCWEQEWSATERAADTFVAECEVTATGQQLPHQAAQLVRDALADALLHLPLMGFHVRLPVGPTRACEQLSMFD